MHSHKLEKSRNLREDDKINPVEVVIEVDAIFPEEEFLIRNKCSSMDLTRKMKQGIVE